MDNHILIFKGTCGSFVDHQIYPGKIPPEKNTITLDDSEYRLSIVDYNDRKYLVAHKEALDREAVQHAIQHHNPEPIQSA